MYDKILEFFFPTPRICVLCGQTLAKIGICLSCQEKYNQKKINLKQCRRCGTYGYCGDICDTCRNWPQYMIGNKALWPYEDEVREAVAAYKYRGEPWRVTVFAQALVSLLEEDVTWLVPVPLHKKRKQERGYNQSALLCKALSKLYPVQVANQALIRQVDTPHQVGLSKTERRQNLQNAFAPGPDFNKLTGHVILVDDVLTTGTTLRSCMTIVHKSKAEKLSSLTLAAGVH